MDQRVNTMTRFPQRDQLNDYASVLADRIPRSINAQIKVSKTKLPLKIM